MRNKVKSDCTHEYTLGTGETLAAGQVYIKGDFAGVSMGNYVEGDVAVIHLEGLFTLKKKTGEAWTVGAKLYWDASGSQVTTADASGANAWLGWAEYPQVSGATEGVVRLKLS